MNKRRHFIIMSVVSIVLSFLTTLITYEYLSLSEEGIDTHTDIMENGKSEESNAYFAIVGKVHSFDKKPISNATIVIDNDTIKTDSKGGFKFFSKFENNTVSVKGIKEKFSTNEFVTIVQPEVVNELNILLKKSSYDN